MRIYEGHRQVGPIARRGPWEGCYFEYAFYVCSEVEDPPTGSDGARDPDDARRPPRLIETIRSVAQGES